MTECPTCKEASSANALAKHLIEVIAALADRGVRTTITLEMPSAVVQLDGKPAPAPTSNDVPTRSNLEDGQEPQP